MHSSGRYCRTQRSGAKGQNGRRISLHLSDADAMAWGSIDNGGAGDSVWLDRSWDEGVSWPGGSSLGRVSTPGGATGNLGALIAAASG